MKSPHQFGHIFHVDITADKEPHPRHAESPEIDFADYFLSHKNAAHGNWVRLIGELQCKTKFELLQQFQDYVLSSESRVGQISRHEGSPEERTAGDRQLSVLRADRDKLNNQVQLQQSRIAELRRTAARETQRYDQLLSSHVALEQAHFELLRRYDERIDLLTERDRANAHLQRAVLEKHEGSLRMLESHEGIVIQADEERVIVMYDIKGDVVEQTYERDQFLGNRLPGDGTRLSVYVIMCETRPSNPTTDAQELDESDDPAIGRRKPIEGKIEF